MRWTDIEADQIHVEQSKTGKRLWVSIHKDLKAVLITLPRSGAFVLVDEQGEAWTDEAFKSAWRRLMQDDRLAEIKRKRLVFHGLRKSAVVMLLEAGCTDAEVAAITGQSRDMVEHYALAVSQRRLAAAAILKWEGAGRAERH
jgi:integrase